MTERTVAWVMMAVGTVLIVGLVVMLATLDNPDLSKPVVRPSTGEGRRCPFLAAAQKLGATIMSVVDDALARVTSFVTKVLDQVKAAKETNDTQTAKLAELQVALDAAVADDAADKATITALQGEVNSLQDSVAAQINAVVDALENPPVAPVVEDVPVEPAPEAPVE